MAFFSNGRAVKRVCQTVDKSKKKKQSGLYKKIKSGPQACGPNHQWSDMKWNGVVWSRVKWNGVK